MIFPKTLLFLASIALIPPAPGSAQSELSLVREGNRAYREQKYLDAEIHYRKALEAEREFSPGTFNLGAALYKQERFPEAAEQYRRAAMKFADPATRASALHNLGNALLKGQKLPESISAYKEALKLNPRDIDTKYNLEYAKALLKKQQDQGKKKTQPRENQEQEEQQAKERDPSQAQAQQQQPEDRRQQSQTKKSQVSREDAERILEALKNEEQNVQKKLLKRAPARVKVEKDW